MGYLLGIFPNRVRRPFAATRSKHRLLHRLTPRTHAHANGCRGGPLGIFPKWGPTGVRGHNISKAFLSTVANSKYIYTHQRLQRGTFRGFFLMGSDARLRPQHHKSIVSTIAKSKYTPTAAKGEFSQMGSDGCPRPQNLKALLSTVPSSKYTRRLQRGTLGDSPQI